MTRLIGLVAGFVFSGSLLATIGDACKSSDECGVREQCVLEFNQGYCVQFDCSKRSACSDESMCMLVEPENFSLCLKKCTQHSDCRTGYRCYEQGVCLP